ncbi:MAG: YitT family protein [Oscillospiraceae bacterium]
MLLSKNKKNLNIAGHYLIMIVGVAILGFGLFNIHSQSKITEGGILGLTLLFQNWFGISPGISGICIDAACYFIGYKMLGGKFLKNAIFASVCFSILYNIFEKFGYVLPDLSDFPLSAAILGGIFVGIGVGLVVREGGASGGDDALALILCKLTKCRIAKAYFWADFAVLVLSITYIPLVNVFFSLISVMLSSFIIDKFQA